MNTSSKRLFDFLFSIVLIVATLPFQILLAIILLIELKENPFFIQERALTYGKKHFFVLKFRTIKSKLAKSIKQDKDIQKFLIRKIDFKITPVARWLRKSGIDEFLQVYNVLLGQMSFVGPRPLMIDELLVIKDNYREQHSIRKVFTSIPGITGVWQVSGDRNFGIDNLMGLDLFYEENKFWRLDLKILFFTSLLLFRSKNIGPFLPRIFSINGDVSISNREFITDHSRYIKNDTEKIKSYMICIPDDWWFVNNSYNNSKPINKKGNDVRKEQLIKNFHNN